MHPLGAAEVQRCVLCKMCIAPVTSYCTPKGTIFTHLQKMQEKSAASIWAMSVSLFPVLQITLCPVLCVLSTDLIDLTPAVDNRAAVFSYVRERVAKSCLFSSWKHQCVLDAPQSLTHSCVQTKTKQTCCSVFMFTWGRVQSVILLKQY